MAERKDMVFTDYNWRNNSSGLPFRGHRGLWTVFNAVKLITSWIYVLSFSTSNLFLFTERVSETTPISSQNTHIDDKNRFSSDSDIPHITTTPYSNM